MRTSVRRATLFLAVLFDLAMLVAAQAQVPSEYFGGPGRSINGDIRAAVQAQWEQLPPAEIACVARRLNQRGRSINAIIGQGIGPSDGRMARFRRACQSAAQNQPDQAQAQDQAGVARTGPSFDCRRASSDDEIAICGNAELSRLDRTIGDGFNYLRSRYGSRAARHVTDPMLRQREDCADDVACIKRIQQMTISLLQSRGAPIQAEEAMPPSGAPATVVGPGNPPPPAPQPAPATPVEQTPQASQPPKPAAVPAPATPPVAQDTTPAPTAVAPEAPPVKPAEAPSRAAPIRDVAPGITAAPTANPAPVTTAAAKSDSGSPVYLLLAIIIALCGVIGLLLLRLARARPSVTAAASAIEPVLPAKPAAPELKPADDAIIPAATSMPAAATSAVTPAPAMDLASLTPTDKPVDEPAPVAEPHDLAAASVAAATPATTGTVPTEKPVAP